MRCKRCGCTEDAPCITAVERPDRSHEQVPCAWVIPKLCSACLTEDEQRIITAMYGNRDEVLGAATGLTIFDTVDEGREAMQRGLFPRLLQALAGVAHDNCEADEDLLDRAWELAGKAAARLFPEPSRILTVNDLANDINARLRSGGR